MVHIWPAIRGKRFRFRNCQGRFPKLTILEGAFNANPRFLRSSHSRDAGAERVTVNVVRGPRSPPAYRMYWVYTPASYQVGTAVPLIMVLHGCMQPFYSHPWAIAYDTHMNQLAEAHQFLVVYPASLCPPGR